MSKKIKVIYRKNLKMSSGKIASQVAHATMRFYREYFNADQLNIVVLGVSDAKFYREVRARQDVSVQFDKGLTEVEEGTVTAAAWIETYE